MVTSRRSFHVSFSLIDGQTNTTNILQEYLSGPGQSCATRRSLEQRCANVVFEFLDGARKRRLLDVKAFCCTCEMQFLSDSDEATQVTKFHIHPSQEPAAISRVRTYP